MKFGLKALFSLFFTIAFSLILYSAPPIKVERSVVGSGGMLELKNSAGLTLSGLIGQIAIDRIATSNRILYQGFWVPIEAPTDVDEEPITLSENLRNYPNPASTGTTFRYNLQENSYVALKVYDLVGNVVKVLYEGFQTAGDQEIFWDLKGDNFVDVPSGNYMYELSISPAQIAGLSDSRTKTIRNILVIVK
ncbi:MAG: T9SS type A sorting domain-containing protein [Ignavibacteria bacterium]|nr:T9SS type A sorting domain-containing protein [Ignavibacteria bacterium]